MKEFTVSGRTFYAISMPSGAKSFRIIPSIYGAHIGYEVNGAQFSSGYGLPPNKESIIIGLSKDIVWKYWGYKPDWIEDNHLVIEQYQNKPHEQQKDTN